MSQQPRPPRRPAMLEAEDAEYIIGDEDPADGAALAHTSAWALMGVGDDEFGPEAVARLRETIRTEGTDVVADMWSRSPEFTLPGALWRLYLLAEWYREDRVPVELRFEEGRGARIIPGLEPPPPASCVSSPPGRHTAPPGSRTPPTRSRTRSPPVRVPSSAPPTNSTRPPATPRSAPSTDT